MNRMKTSFCFTFVLLVGLSLAQDENVVIRDIQSIFQQSMENQFNEGLPWLRQAHGKQHGCVRGYLFVDSSVPDYLQQGVFANTSGQYPLFIRFSNGAGRGFVPSDNDNVSDTSLDTRGLAMKLFQVPGTKLVQPDAETQDFLMTTSRVGFLRDLNTALSYFQAVQKGKLALAGFLALHPRTALLYAKFGLDGIIADYLTADFWSQTAYAMGSSLVGKFHLGPVQCPFGLTQNFVKTTGKEARQSSFNMYTTQLQLDLAGGDYCLNISVQLYSDADSTPIDDTTVTWDTPFTNLGTVYIPHQSVWSREQEKFCRDMSFNPWHSVEAHTPLGVISRIRRVIYTKGATQRHMYEEVPDREPTMADWIAYGQM